MAIEPKTSQAAYSLPHLRIERFARGVPYRPKGRRISERDAGRERFSHGGKLNAELAQALAVAHRILADRDDATAAGKAGAYVEIASDAGEHLPDKGWSQQGIRIAAVRLDDAGSEIGGLFVPARAEQFLADTLAAYSDGDSGPAATKRIEQIGRIGPGTLETLWVDHRPLPEPDQRIWWECWCWKELAKNLIRPAERLGLRISEQRLLFPDFEVIPVYGTRAHIEKLLAHTDAIEELRHASDTPHVYTHEVGKYRVPLVKDLASRITPAELSAPAACVLDTGVARAHPLLASSLAVSDWQAVDENWGKDDHYKGTGHGTQVAGAALLGDLTYPVGDQRQIKLTHRLESVKLLPPKEFVATEPASYGRVTQSAISMAESAAPHRDRVFCMTPTNRDLSGDRPTSWSAAMDQAAAGAMPGESTQSGVPKRLVIVSAGNIPDYATAAEAADHSAFPIEDPAQSWNSLTVGGFTDLDSLPHPLYRDWAPAAEVGDRSPYSRTSCDWPDTTPIKPEIVFEAGNRGLSPSGELLAGIESLSVLSTNKDFVVEPLCPFWATSAAAADATRQAAVIAATHPSYWPETVRALMVHSARWTPAMLARFKAAKGRKAQHILLAREFGYGVPNLDRALASANSDLGLVAQAVIQPFILPTKPGKRGKDIGDGEPKFHEVHIYQLPWPKERLQELGDKRVELSVTLSYFIEPSPGQYAPVMPARYRSHGLRFDLQRRLETEPQFLARINDLAAAYERAEDEPEIEPEGDRGWTFGPNSRANRTAGSLHCDVWRGPGADLALRRTVAVYPVAGWWKNRVPKRRYNSKARYALVMTLRCLDQDVDLYSEIQAEITNRIAAEAKV